MVNGLIAYEDPDLTKYVNNKIYGFHDRIKVSITLPCRYPFFFQWLGVYYAQMDGCAMGDSTSTPVSNAYMTEFEKDILTRYRHIHDPPTSHQHRLLSASSSSGSARLTTP